MGFTEVTAFQNTFPLPYFPLEKTSIATLKPGYTKLSGTGVSSEAKERLKPIEANATNKLSHISLALRGSLLAIQKAEQEQQKLAFDSAIEAAKLRQADIVLEIEGKAEKAKGISKTVLFVGAAVILFLFLRT